MAEDEQLKKELKMACKSDAISPTIASIKEFIFQVDSAIDDLDFRLEMTAREMLANAVEHGCNDPDKFVDIIIYASKSEVILQVRDPGPGFNWEDIEWDNMPVLSEKGRGLCMIKKAVDRVEFNDPGNEITIYFKSQ